MNRRRNPVRRSHSPGVIRPPFVLFPAAGVGIASQNLSFDRISGPVSCAPMMTGALDQTSAAAFRLLPDLGKLARRMEFPSLMPCPAPVIWPRYADFREVPAVRKAADTAFSPAAISACIKATGSGANAIVTLTAPPPVATGQY
jgi:hypothetical protein